MTQALALQPQQAGLSEQIQYANAVSRAGLLPQAYRNKPADIIVVMGLGQSMGLSPMESVYRINVIQGKPTASAELIAAQVRKAGHKLRLKKDEAHQSVTCTIIRADDPEAPFSVTRDRRWAEQMGLINKDNYKKQPMTMLTWRAITACAREACPEALYGVAYTPDEMHDMDSAPAEPVQAEVVAEPQAEPLQPVRDLFKTFCHTANLTPEEGVRHICEHAGVERMQDITAEMVDDVLEFMTHAEAITNYYEGEDIKADPDYIVPDLMPEEVDF